MTDNITVISRAQSIKVDPASKMVSVTNAGPIGPTGPPGPPGEGSFFTDTGLDHLTGDIIQHVGPVWTAHDAKYWYASDFRGTAVVNDNAGTKNAPGIREFSDSSTQFIKWLWTPGDGWQYYDIRIGLILPGFVASNTSRWRYSEERWTVGDTTTAAGAVTNVPAEVASITVQPITAVGGGNRYETIASDVPWSNPFEVVLSCIERVHDHADDTQAGAMGLYIATATRTDGP